MASPPIPEQPVSTRGGVDVRYDFFQGRWILDSRRSFATETTFAYVKKRVIRRVITGPGNFSHLPTYGMNLREKELYTSTRLAEIKMNALEQILEEEDVVSADVRATAPAPGTLVLQIQLVTIYGAGSFAVSVGDDGAATIS